MLMRSSDTLRVEVLLNGDQTPGLLRASVSTTNHFSADTYALTFAIGNSSPKDIAFWSILSSGLIEVTAVTSTIYGPTFQSLITGLIDTIHIDPIQRTVGIEGRDLSSSMIDSYRQQDFVNQTASEIVATIAQYHNLAPVVTPTTGNIGRYYSDGYTKLSLGQFSRLQSDWDLVVQLARQNNFDVFVEGQSLYFQPDNGFDGPPLPVSLRQVQSARIERNIGISPNTAAKVQSWNSQNMAAYDSGNSSVGTIAADQSASARNLPFLFSGSNYTAQQVTDAAERYTAELTRLGTVLNLGMPWDLSFAPRVACLLQGTDSVFDTIYRIESVERHYCSTSGSTQLIRAVQI
jgi:phage protein D